MLQNTDFNLVLSVLHYLLSFLILFHIYRHKMMPESLFFQPNLWMIGVIKIIFWECRLSHSPYPRDRRPGCPSLRFHCGPAPAYRRGLDCHLNVAWFPSLTQKQSWV